MPSPASKSGVVRLLADLNATRFGLFDDREPRERRAALLGRIAEYGLVSLILIVLAGMEIGRWYFNAPPQPLLMGMFAGGVILYSAVRVALILPQVRVLNRERHARRDLREVLSRLCSRGYMLFDGVKGNGGRSFSVLVGPTGVFSLTRRIVPRGTDLSESIECGADGRITVGGREMLADPLGQAAQAAADLRMVLESGNLAGTGVRPVLVFPGWNVIERRAPEERGVLVVSEWTLTEEIQGVSATLEPAGMIAVSLRLEQLARGGAE